MLGNGSCQFNIYVVLRGLLHRPQSRDGIRPDGCTGNLDFRSVVMPTGIGDGLNDMQGLGPANQITP